MSYPALPILAISKRDRRDIRRNITSQSGDIFGVDTSINVPSSFEIRHNLTTAQWATLEDFWLANHGIAFTITYDGVVFTVRFIEPPQRLEVGSALFSVTVKLEEVGV